ncbi:MAG: DUF4920 domain-containing protein [Bernardetiaceae bacterium]|nr:DUF4920 domain-containing protein [Bernardetiaceae bacterium]
MKKTILSLILAVAFLYGCQSNEKNETAQAAEEQSENTENNETENQDIPLVYFGAEISPDDAIPTSEILARLAEVDSMEIKVVGTIKKICQKKGCWMNVDLGEGDKDLFVRFKDYDFFMPMDAAGNEAVMQGWVKKEVISVADLQHYAEDAGKSKEEIAAITEPETKISFMADGVIIKGYVPTETEETDSKNTTEDSEATPAKAS